MFIQTENTPNPNSLKFLPGRKVSNDGPHEFTDKESVKNSLIRNLLSINGITGIFIGTDFLTANKDEHTDWEDVKHIVISYIRVR